MRFKIALHFTTDTTFNSTFAYQTATTRTDKPDAPATVGSGQTNTGELCSDIITPDFSGVAFVRFGLAYKIASGTIGQADVSYQLTYESCGRVVGTQQLSPVTSSTANSFLPLTGWLPALQAEVMKAVVVMTGKTGNFRCRLSYRTATTSPESPGSWNADVAGTSYMDTDGSYNTDEVSMSVSAAMWVQVGLQFNSTSAGVFSTANLTIATMVQKA